jgi:hypothetical protein
MNEIENDYIYKLANELNLSIQEAFEYVQNMMKLLNHHNTSDN